MPVTMKDVAAAAGVSQPTVSVVLSGKKTGIRVSEATRKRILAAVEQLNYHPNAAAKALVTQRTDAIGLFLSAKTSAGWANPYFATVFGEMEAACRERGYALHACRYDLSTIESFIFPKQVRERALDGVVTTGYVSAEVMERFRDAGIPCVCLGSNQAVAPVFPVVCHDLAGSCLDVVRAGAELGHRRFALAGPKGRWRRRCVEAVQRSLAECPALAGCSFELLTVSSATWDHRAGLGVVDEWLSLASEVRPTVLVANPMTAMGILQALPSRGLRCPDDLSLVADADTILSELASPRLASIDQCIPELAEQACKLLIGQIEARDCGPAAPLETAIPGRFMPRPSLGRDQHG